MPQGELTDDLLLKAIKADDNKAFKVLFLKYYKDLCVVSNNITQDSGAAEEIVSDLFLSLWQRRKNLKIATNLGAYLYASIKNRSLNFKNTVTYKQTVKSRTLSSTYISSEPNPYETIVSEENLFNLKKEIASLPPRRQHIFTLNIIEGKSFDEIANQLSISPKTVRNHVQKTLKYFKENN